MDLPKCINNQCQLRISCERFYDPARRENQAPGEDTDEHVSLDADRDLCFVLRNRLRGTMDVHREWTKTTKRHRRRGGNWI